MTKFFISNWITLLLVIQIAAAPLVMDAGHLPIGWEVPKVYFSWVMILFAGAIALCVGFANWAAGFMNSREEAGGRPHQKPWARLRSWLWRHKWWLLFVGIMLATTIEPLSWNRNWNDIRIYGNEFRKQGFILWMTLVPALVLAVNHVSRRGITWLAIAYWVSGVVEALIGYKQVWNSLAIGWSQRLVLWDVQRIYGSFGQGNFFTGRILIALVLGLMLFHQAKGRRNKFIIGLLNIITALIIPLTDSGWGKLVLGVVLLTEVGRIAWGKFSWLREKISWGQVFVLCRLVGYTMLIVVMITLVYEKLPNHRVFIWEITGLEIFNFRNLNQIKQMIMGHGFDILAIDLATSGFTPRNYIDRAHNIFLEGMYAVGLLGFAALSAVIGLLYVKLPGYYAQAKSALVRLHSQEYFYWLFALDTMILRGVLHTNSIINAIDLIFPIIVLWRLTALYSQTDKAE